MHIPDIIRARRKVLGLSCRKLGLACGYAYQSAERIVQLWESGTRNVPAKRIRALSKALDLPITAFVP